MISSDRAWYRQAGASPDALAALGDQAGVELPAEYFQLLAFSNGGEGPLPVDPYNFCLNPAERVLDHIRDAEYDEFFPGLFAFGSSGGGMAIAFDTRFRPPWPIVSFVQTNINLKESVRRLAPDFASFLRLVGREQ